MLFCTATVKLRFNPCLLEHDLRPKIVKIKYDLILGITSIIEHKLTRSKLLSYLVNF